MVRSRFLLKGGHAVLEELLLPAVENGWLQAEIIADLPWHVRAILMERAEM